MATLQTINKLWKEKKWEHWILIRSILSREEYLEIKGHKFIKLAFTSWDILKLGL